MSYIPPTVTAEAVFSAYNTTTQSASVTDQILTCQVFNDCSQSIGATGGVNLPTKAMLHGQIRTDSPPDQVLYSIKFDNMAQNGGFGGQFACNSTVRTDQDDGAYGIGIDTDVFMRTHRGTKTWKSDVNETRIMGFLLNQ